jgi:hypothetical protein
LWYAGPNAVTNAIGYALHRSRSHNAVIRVVNTVFSGKIGREPFVDFNGRSEQFVDHSLSRDTSRHYRREVTFRHEAYLRE